MTTTASEGRQEAEEVAQEAAPEPLRRQARTRASSLTPGGPTSLRMVTQRVQVMGRLLASGAALLDKPGSLVHAQPMTFAQARDRHHECAGHYEALLLRWPRLFWGYFHLLIIKPALNLLEWVTESPARFLVTAVIVIVIWLFA